MYNYPLISAEELYQGDIIFDYPFLNLGDVRILQATNDGLREAEGVITSSTSAVSVRIDPRQVMIISQTCDAQRRENLIICPIYGVNEYVAASNPNADKLRSLRDGKIYYWLYLPAFQNVLEESFVDLQQFVYVPRIQLLTHQEQRKISLSDLGRHRLAWSVSSFFGRPL